MQVVGPLLAAVVLLAPRAGASAPGPVRSLAPESEPDEAGAMWFDGHDLMLVGGRGAVHRRMRGGESVAEEVDLALPIDADGTRAIAGGLAVFVDDRGRAARYREGHWESVTVPLLEGDEVVAVAVDAKGRAYCVGGARALYLWDEEQWRTHVYPTAFRPLAAATSPGGQLFIVGHRGLAVRFDDGRFEPVIAGGLGASSLEQPWHAAWYGAASETLWVRAGRDRLLEIDVVDRVAHEHFIPEYDASTARERSATTVLAGRALARGDVLAVAMGRSVYTFAEGRFTFLGSVGGIVRDLVIDGDDEIVVVAHDQGLTRLSMFGAAEQPDPPLSAEERKLLESNLRWRLRVARIRARKPLFVLPTLRVQPGVAFHPGDPDAAAFDLEVGVGALMAPLEKRGKGAMLWLWPEVGYHLDAHERRGGHAVDLGLGLGVGTHIIAAFYRPAADFGVLASSRGAVAFHHAASVQVLWGVVGIGFGQRIVGDPGGVRYGYELGLTFNLIPWLWLAVL